MAAGKNFWKYSQMETA